MKEKCSWRGLIVFYVWYCVKAGHLHIDLPKMFDALRKMGIPTQEINNTLGMMLKRKVISIENDILTVIGEIGRLMALSKEEFYGLGIGSTYSPDRSKKDFVLDLDDWAKGLGLLMAEQKEEESACEIEEPCAPDNVVPLRKPNPVEVKSRHEEAMKDLAAYIETTIQQRVDAEVAAKVAEHKEKEANWQNERGSLEKRIEHLETRLQMGQKPMAELLKIFVSNEEGKPEWETKTSAEQGTAS